MRRFLLERVEDASGVSGTGIVAEGCQYTAGQCVIVWLTQFKTVEVLENIQAVMHIHGHHGKTKVVFLDEEIV